MSAAEKSTPSLCECGHIPDDHWNRARVPCVGPCHVVGCSCLAYSDVLGSFGDRDRRGDRPFGCDARAAGDYLMGPGGSDFDH